MKQKSGRSENDMMRLDAETLRAEYGKAEWWMMGWLQAQMTQSLRNKCSFTMHLHRTTAARIRLLDVQLEMVRRGWKLQ